MADVKTAAANTNTGRMLVAEAREGFGVGINGPHVQHLARAAIPALADQMCGRASGVGGGRRGDGHPVVDGDTGDIGHFDFDGDREMKTTGPLPGWVGDGDAAC